MTELKAMVCDGGCGARWIADPMRPTSMQSCTLDGWFVIMLKGLTLHTCSPRCMGSLASKFENDPTWLNRRELTA